MSQQPTDDFDIDAYTTSGPQLATYLNNLNNALLSMRSGVLKPPSAQAGTMWLDTSDSFTHIVKFYDGTTNYNLFEVQPSMNRMVLSNYILGITGKNALINGNKKISQRGDYTSATAMVTNKYFIDRHLNVLSGVAATLQDLGYSYSNNSNVIKLLATSNGSTSADYFATEQHIEDARDFAERTVTYTVDVKSNTLATIVILDGGTPAYSTPHSGSGAWETLTVVKTLDSSITSLSARVTSYYPTTTVSIGDYIEIGNEQFELGSTFTGFEVIDETTQLLKCQRYYETSYGTANYPGDIYASGTLNSTGISTSASTGHRYVVQKRIAPTITIYSPSSGNSGAIDNLRAGSDAGQITTNNENSSGFSSLASGNASLIDFATYEYHYEVDAEIYS